MISRRTLLVLAFAMPVAARANPSASAAPIAALNAGLLKIMNAGKDTAFTGRYDILKPVVEKTFDLVLILRNSVGPNRWSAFPPNLQAELLDIFTRFTVSNWVANFDAFDGETFQILPELRKVGADEVVQTRIVPRTGEPTRLDYVMRRSGDDWRAVDILLDGSISRVAVQRSDFRALLKDGNPAALITMLREKVTALAAGAKS